MKATSGRSGDRTTTGEPVNGSGSTRSEVAQEIRREHRPHGHIGQAQRARVQAQRQREAGVLLGLDLAAQDRTVDRMQRPEAVQRPAGVDEPAHAAAPHEQVRVDSTNHLTDQQVASARPHELVGGSHHAARDREPAERHMVAVGNGVRRLAE